MSRAPKKISAKHLQKDAIVYVRQSAQVQVATQNPDQVRLAEVAQRWGWADQQIHIIDSDRGIAGTLASTRPGFNEVLRRIDSGTVGVLIVRDLAHLSRDPDELRKLTERAEQAGTVVVTSAEIEG
jgi:DNA invertase Pin-like site-specific DNA recombinase